MMLTLQIAYESLSAAKLSPVILCNSFVSPKGQLEYSPRAISIYCPRACRIIYFQKLFELFETGFNYEYVDAEETILLIPVNPTFQLIVNYIYQSNIVEMLHACEKMIENKFKPETLEYFHLFNLLKWKLLALSQLS